MRWKQIAHLSLSGKTREVLPEYDRLYRWLGKDGLFLYNHAAELHEAREYEKSAAVFEKCVRHFNDMDVQMLLADNYRKLGLYAKAERHLQLASGMCPSRFMPLYELVRLYEATDHMEEALELASIIVDKEVKIPSATITAIKNEMRRLIEEQGSDNDPAKQGRTSNKSDHEQEQRQGETPKVRSNGATLPP